MLHLLIQTVDIGRFLFIAVNWLLILDWCPSSEYQAPKHQPNQLPSAANVMIDDSIIPLEILFKISNTDINCRRKFILFLE